MLMTLCYLEKDDKFLMLHRTKKENDVNKGKWIGVGGKLEKDETPLQCIKREIKEETGFDAHDLEYRGLVVFNYNDNPPEYMFVYNCKNFSGEILDNCKEGVLKWIDKNELFDLNIWEGDRIFLSLILNNSPFFYLTLNYNNDKLISHELEFKDDGYSVFEVFIPEDYINNVISSLGRYNLLKEGNYDNVYASIDVIGHWTTLPGANPFDGEIGKSSSEPEKMIKFRVKNEFKELAYKLIKENHPYEVPIINIY